MTASIVEDINAGAGSSQPGSFAVSPNGLLFAATTPALGRELWTNATGTQPVKDINDTQAGASAFFLEYGPAGRLVPHAGLVVLFPADDGLTGMELWSSNGLGSGTELLADINPLGDDSDIG
ncbi:MAG: hypothetical protein L0Z62_06475 [Gemmataceae bacterium]|nr:hypothetical protein [Gemmataceae bacterium]